MSASYGNYLTEEDPNKKKPEGTTPSATATTVTGGTTTPPLTYEGFVGTGSGSQAYQTNVGYVNDQYNASVNAANTNKEMGTQYAQAQKDSIYGAANTNKELGMSYAEGVKNSIYGNAAAQRAEADKNTEAARQRGIIDSKSSYQKAVGAYGSNAETLAGRGLSGSGYGEYLTADAYATHRGQVQNINADALRANREAAYAENQAKMAADSEYLKNLYGINTEYNKAVSGADSEYLKNLYGINTEYNAAMNKAESDRTTGMYQAALGLNKEQNTAYGKLFDSAAKGMSIDAIMQDGTWGDLTSEQQQAITAEAERFANDKSVNEFKGLIDGGTSLEDIQNSEAWSKLTPAQQTDVTNYYNNKQSGDALETDSNYLGLLSDINRGALTIGAIKNTAMWNTLSESQQLQLEAAAALKGKTEMKDRMGVYADLAAKGVSLEDIKTMMAINGDKYVEELTPEEYEKLSDEEKAEYDEARNFMKLIESGAQKYSDDQTTQQNEANYNTAFELLEDGWTVEQIRNHLGDEAWAALEKSGHAGKIENAKDVIDSIKKETEGKKANESLSSYIKLAKEGWDIDSIVAIAKALGHYDVLAGTKIEEGKEGAEEGKTLWDSVIAEAEKFTNQNATNDTITNIEDAINDGATLEDIQKMPGYDELDPEVQEQIGEQVTARDEQKELATDAIAISLEGYESLSEVEKYLTSEMVPESERAGIIAKWQSNNAKEFEDILGEAKFENGALTVGGEAITGADLYEDIKNGMYGDEGGKVFGKYLDLLVQTAIDTTTPISDAFAIQGLLNTLENDLRAEKISDLELLVSKAKQKVPRDIVPSISAVFDTKTIDGKAYVTIDGVAVEDWKTIPNSVRVELDKIASTTANVKTIKVRDTIYYRNSKDGKWYAYKIVQNNASTTSNKGGTTR